MSAIPPASPGRGANPTEPVPGGFDSRRRRLLALGIVLFVSFGHFIASSAHYLLLGLPRADPQQLQFRLVGALISEAASLAVLWYVLTGQSRGWKNIGWKLKWTDAPLAVGLFFGSTIASYMVMVFVQVFFRAYSGHYIVPRSLHGLLGFGISGLAIVFVCLNPFFEELIVRGYLMTEIVELGGGGALAIIISVAVQMSYHLYQGLAHGIALTASFAVFSLYFWKSHRIAPVVLAHLCIDAYALIRASF
jgi:membrane protease YdiL (CAAX protease family)